MSATKTNLSTVYLATALVFVLVIAIVLLAEQWQRLETDVAKAETQFMQLQQQSAQYQGLLGPQKRNWQVFASHGQIYAWLSATQKTTLANIGLTIAPWSKSEGSKNEDSKNKGLADAGNNNTLKNVVAGPVVVLSIKTTVNLEQLMNWLYQLQANSNIIIHRLNLNKAEPLGQVSGYMELSYRVKNSIEAPSL